MVDDRAPDQDLVAARTGVLVSIEQLTARGGPSLRPATLHTNQPLSELPTVLAGKLAARAARSASGRRRRWPAMRDPLRLTATDRRILSRARSWQSRQPWIGARSGSVERCLMLVAVDIVAHIASNALWASHYLDDHRVGLNLAAELDQIDEQAYRLAKLRDDPGAVTMSPTEHAAVLDQGWDALVDRVAALSIYANRLSTLEREPAAHGVSDRTEAHDDARIAHLVAGAVRDELASNQVRTLAADLRRMTVTSDETWYRSAP